MRTNPKVVVIGGGTGTLTVLTGLKRFPYQLSVVVSMMDSGGSNRILRDEFDLLPTSDIRQCIVALASNKTDKILRDLFIYRYSKGTGISGMTFGNLFMAALTDICGSQQEAITKTCQILGVQGSVIPVTFDNSHLLATYDGGFQILGEHFIDEPIAEVEGKRITALTLVPKARANPDAQKVIKQADVIIIGPGDMYTSVVCNFVVDGITQSLATSKARIIYIVNLMTRPGQTHNFTAFDHVSEIEKYIGRRVDVCVVNNPSSINKKHLKWYAGYQSTPVVNDLKAKKWQGKVVVGRIASGELYKKSKADKLVRSLVRHDPDKLAKLLRLHI